MIVGILEILAVANIAFLRSDNSSQYQLSSQTGARSARHSLRPQTSVFYRFLTFFIIMA